MTPPLAGAGGVKWGKGWGQEVEETKPGAALPKSPVPSHLARAAPWSRARGIVLFTLRAPPGRGDGIQGTPALAARGLRWGRRLPGALRRWPGLGKLARRARGGEAERERRSRLQERPPGAREKEEPAEEERERGQEARRAST